MRRSPRPLPLLAAALAVALAGACSDSTGPGAGVGHYRLAAVNGQPVPYYTAPSLGGPSIVIRHGDLLVRADGTFLLGMPEQGMAILADGRWHRVGSSLRLTFPPVEPGGRATELSATVDADSVVLEAGQGHPSWTPLRTYVFRLAPPPRPPVRTGAYVLGSMNGRTDLTVEDSSGGYRRVHRVLFDSVTFIDGLFFRRHRSERTEWYRDPSDSGHGSEEWVTFGSYDGADGVLVLRDYRSGPWIPVADSLVVGEGTLTRRTPALDPQTGGAYVWEDVYARR